MIISETEVRPIIDFPRGFLAGYSDTQEARWVAGETIYGRQYENFLIRVYLTTKAHHEWELKEDPIAYQLVMDAAETLWLGAVHDYLVEKGLPDWASELIKENMK